MKMHTAQSGKNAGRLVRCFANSCTINSESEHMNFDSMKEADEYSDLRTAKEFGGVFGDGISSREAERLSELEAKGKVSVEKDWSKASIEEVSLAAQQGDKEAINALELEEKNLEERRKHAETLRNNLLPGEMMTDDAQDATDAWDSYTDRKKRLDAAKKAASQGASGQNADSNASSENSSKQATLEDIHVAAGKGDKTAIAALAEEKRKLQESRDHAEALTARLFPGEILTDEAQAATHAWDSYMEKEREFNAAKGVAAVDSLVSRNARPQYIAAIDSKHFDASRSGSTFTDKRVSNTEDVLKEASRQRGGLDGDDRAALIKEGADPKSFLPESSGVRYLKVRLDGTQALKSTESMGDNEVLTVVAKGGNDGRPSSLSFSTDVKEQPKTKFATVVVGPNMDKEKKPIPGTQVLWTMHPGVPTRGIRSDTVREKGLDGGSQVTVKQLREMFGKDIQVNTRVA